MMRGREEGSRRFVCSVGYDADAASPLLSVDGSRSSSSRRQAPNSGSLSTAVADGDTRRGLRIGEVRQSYGTIAVKCQLPR